MEEKKINSWYARMHTISFFLVTMSQPLRYVFRFFLSSVAGVFFSPCASVLSRDSDFKIGGSAVFVPKLFSTADQGHWEHRELYFFLRSKKKSNKWRRRRKKI